MKKFEPKGVQFNQELVSSIPRLTDWLNDLLKYVTI